MLSFAAQVPPLGRVASQRTRTAPVERSIVSSLLFWKKPIDRPLGDQNGYVASVVLATGRDASETTERITSEPRDRITRLRPSGETLNSVTFISHSSSGPGTSDAIIGSSSRPRCAGAVIRPSTK